MLFYFFIIHPAILTSLAKTSIKKSRLHVLLSTYLVSTWFLSLLVGVAFLTLESLLLALACSLHEQFIGCSQLAYNVNILELDNINRSSSAHAVYELS